MNTASLIEAVRAAWTPVPPPPAEDVRYLAWAYGVDTRRLFAGVAPVDVDISAPGFLACTPLLELPPGAAAAYLGTYLLSLLDGMRFQEDIGVFYDILTRAHTLACLSDPDFWERVIRPNLSPECKEALVQIAAYLGEQRELLALSTEQCDLIKSLAAGEGRPSL